jgi:hypothetical protein
MAGKWLPLQDEKIAHVDGDFNLVPNAPEFVGAIQLCKYFVK